MENMNRDRQYKDSARFVAISMLGIIALIILMTLFGGCATTYNTSKECCKSTKTSTK